MRRVNDRGRNKNAKKQDTIKRNATGMILKWQLKARNNEELCQQKVIYKNEWQKEREERIETTIENKTKHYKHVIQKISLPSQTFFLLHCLKCLSLLAQPVSGANSIFYVTPSLAFLLPSFTPLPHHVYQLTFLHSLHLPFHSSPSVPSLFS